MNRFSLRRFRQKGRVKYQKKGKWQLLIFSVDKGKGRFRIQAMKAEATTSRSRQFSWLATALLGLFMIQITGCSSVPDASPAMKQQALSFTPPPGKAGVYVIRPYHMLGAAILNNISLDYQVFGALGTSSYLYGTVSPGLHTLRNTDLPSAIVVPFTTEAGKNYYFVANASLAANGIAIESISETDGQAYVRKFKLSGKNRFELQNQSGETK